MNERERERERKYKNRFKAQRKQLNETKRSKQEYKQNKKQKSLVIVDLHSTNFNFSNLAKTYEENRKKEKRKQRTIIRLYSKLKCVLTFLFSL